MIFIPLKGQIYSKQGSHVSLLFGTWTFSIIFMCLDEAKVSAVNSSMTNIEVQHLHETIKWIMYFKQSNTRFNYTLFRKALLLLKCCIFRRVNTYTILHGAIIHATLTKNQVKTISVHFIKTKLPSSQVIYCLPTKEI